MSPSLNSLSVELLDNIFSFVHPPSALCKLALVSWKFNSLATPHLYRHIFLDSDGPGGGFTRMLPFTFLMLRKPSIASLVRSFTFRGQFHNDDCIMIDPDSQCDYDDDEMRLPWPDHPERNGILRRVIEEISQSEEEELEWQQELLPRYAPNDAAIFPLLFISFPNLRRLDMEICSFREEKEVFLERTFNRIVFSEPPFDVKPVFTQLTDIMIIGNHDKYPTAYAFFAACCRLPAVKRLYGHRLGAEHDWSQLSPIETGATCGIDTFELRDSKLHHIDLPVVFGALRSPHTIIYHTGNPWAWNPIRTPEILSAIAIHATSLRRLAIDHGEDYPFEDGYSPDDNRDPISFVDFIALTHLRVAPVFLFGHEGLHDAPELGSADETAVLYRLRGALPQALESLYITNADFVFSDEFAHIAQAFDALLRNKEWALHLRELVFEGGFEDENSKQRAARVIRVAEEMGVDARAIALSQYTNFRQRGWGWDEEVSFGECKHNDIGERVQVLPLPKLSWQN
ncbi:hypothetical protein VE03_04626 [Pseudogymnoascus sp. 23342-1-I1]|nr:hypothetical protein VE03_04626 [Pseudogymnoascus sp. 23342-1-I1]